jgi:hypothetical protein
VATDWPTPVAACVVASGAVGTPAKTRISPTSMKLEPDPALDCGPLASRRTCVTSERTGPIETEL